MRPRTLLLLLLLMPTNISTAVEGTWRAWLDVPGGKLKFELEFVNDDSGLSANLINAGEKQLIPDVQLDGKQLNIDIAHYDSTIAATVSEDDQTLAGSWRKVRGVDSVATIPFHAERIAPQKQPLKRNPAMDHYVGRWKVHFSSDDQPAVAIIRDGPRTTWGTFLTTTGDYRYLAPIVTDEQIELSCFDGAHAFLFRAKRQPDGSLQGDFWSGDWWHETWTAVQDNDFSLPSALELTKWNDQVKLADLVYADLDGNQVSLADPQFQGKARIIEIFGSWCPNCHDAAIYLSELHNKYGPQGLSILGLAFEVTGDPNRDAEQVRRYKKRHNISFPCLLAGVSKKEEASKQIPLLDRIRSYPTTIFIDGDDQVRAVYTGFSGPATGAANTKLKQDFEAAIDTLLE